MEGRGVGKPINESGGLWKVLMKPILGNEIFLCGFVCSSSMREDGCRCRGASSQRWQALIEVPLNRLQGGGCNERGQKCIAGQQSAVSSQQSDVDCMEEKHQSVHFNYFVKTRCPRFAREHDHETFPLSTDLYGCSCFSCCFRAR